jgi:hypothetical protein
MKRAYRRKLPRVSRLIAAAVLAATLGLLAVAASVALLAWGRG